ncbi:hypothetical protein [Nocardia sp. NPDC058633]|uniref:hypothetical protein n=1 Tax=Nocardia sp. NPDC058633 TaxID=3346568 RepID=UPI00364B6148
MKSPARSPTTTAFSTRTRRTALAPLGGAAVLTTAELDRSPLGGVRPRVETAQAPVSTGA